MPPKLQQRQLGSGDATLTTSAIGYGCMGLSEFYGTPLSEKDAIDVIHHAIDAGITHFDTADVYAFGENERILGKAIAAVRDQVTIATKVGIVRSKEDSTKRGVCNTPEYITEAFNASLKRLGLAYVDLIYLHRLNKETPIEESVDALAKLVIQGKARYIGLSEVPDVEILERAHSVHPITVIQMEYSLWSRGIETNGILEACQRLGIGIVAYSPLGRGALTGTITNPETQLAEGDFRRTLPRFLGENFDTTNRNLNQFVAEMAAKKQAETGMPCTQAQISLAWVLAKGDFIVPIPGTKTPSRILENTAAIDITLTPGEVAALDQASSEHAPTAPRYTAAAMAAYHLTA